MDETTTVLQKTEARPDQATISSEDAIKRYCGNCLAADGFDVCTGKGCELYPVTPYRGGDKCQE